MLVSVLPLLAVLALPAPPPPTSAAPTTAAPADVAAPPAGTTPSPAGVATRVLKAGAGRHPRDSDCVTVHLMAWRRDGAFVAGTRHWGEPDLRCLPALPGDVAAAIKAMAIGEQRRLWLPAALAFVAGEDGDAAPVAADTTVDVELMAISAGPPAPRNLRRAPVTARKTPSGLAVEVLRQGKGTQNPTDGSTVKVHFSGWTTAGRLIETSAKSAQPAAFPMVKLMPGWREALWQMVAGDKVRLWIPRAEARAAAARPGRATSDVVYDLELVSFD